MHRGYMTRTVLYQIGLVYVAVALFPELRDVNETDVIQNSASHVTFLSNHWS